MGFAFKGTAPKPAEPAPQTEPTPKPTGTAGSTAGGTAGSTARSTGSAGARKTPPPPPPHPPPPPPPPPADTGAAPPDDARSNRIAALQAALQRADTPEAKTALTEALRLEGAEPPAANPYTSRVLETARASAQRPEPSRAAPSVPYGAPPAPPEGVAPWIMNLTGQGDTARYGRFSAPTPPPGFDPERVAAAERSAEQVASEAEGRAGLAASQQAGFLSDMRSFGRTPIRTADLKSLDPVTREIAAAREAAQGQVTAAQDEAERARMYRDQVRRAREAALAARNK